jgi:hypothetical protein
VIVAVIAVREVQVPADEIVRVIAVGHRLVSAVRAVRVSWIVPATAVPRRALRGIRCIDLDAALVDVIAVNVMQMPVMQVVAMVTMLNALVSTAGLMNMLVRCVRLVVAHEASLALGT